MSVVSRILPRLGPSDNEGFEAVEATRIGEVSLRDRLAEATRAREHAEAERIDATLERCADRLREELWQRLAVHVDRCQVVKVGLRATVRVEGLLFSVFVEESSQAHLQVELACPTCGRGCWSTPVRGVDHLADLLASPRFFTHDCAEDKRF